MKNLLLPFFLLLALFSPALVIAQQDDTFNETLQNAIESTQSAEQDTKDTQYEDYVLPYPGLLPDSPLYLLKTARDRLISILISDVKKKAEFNLLQADKRLQAGVMLIQKDKTKYDLAQTTISKGQNYFEEALDKVKEAEKQKKELGDLKSKLRKAAKKHHAVLTDIREAAPKNEKAKIEVLLKRAEQLEKMTDVFSPESSDK